MTRAWSWPKRHPIALKRSSAAWAAHGRLPLGALDFAHAEQAKGCVDGVMGGSDLAVRQPSAVEVPVGSVALSLQEVQAVFGELLNDVDVACCPELRFDRRLSRGT